MEDFSSGIFWYHYKFGSIDCRHELLWRYGIVITLRKWHSCPRTRLYVMLNFGGAVSSISDVVDVLSEPRL